MFLAIAAVMIGAVSAVVAVRLRESHVGVNDLFTYLARLGSAEGPFAHSRSIVSAEPLDSPKPIASEPADVLFTESLLALSRVGLRAPGDSQAPELAESSSLVSVRPLR